MTLDPLIDPEEALGREVFDSKKAKRLARGASVPDIFLERSGVQELSVDRLDLGTPAELAAIGDANGLARSQQFKGWAAVIAADASKGGRSVRPVRLLTNEYHAEISLNIMDLDHVYEIQQEHSNELAAYARWRPRPLAEG